MDKACKIGFGSFFLLLLIAFAIIVGVYFTQNEDIIIGPGHKEILEEIHVNPGGTLNFDHSGELNVTFCAVRRPDKTIALQNDLIKNPLEDKHISTDDGKIEMVVQGNLCNVTLINTDYNDKGKWELIIRTESKSTLQKHSYEVSVVGERTTWYDQSEVGKPFFMSHTLNTTISTCNVYDPSADSADNATSLTSRIDNERIILSKPDETTCKIVINSTLPDDKGTWRIIIEAEENENNQNTYEYLHILDVEVYPKSFRNWTNNGTCDAIGEDKTCGPGIQKQSRQCMDGSLDKCVAIETEQIVSCDLQDCLKTFGNWTAYEECNADGDDLTCGPGKQNQSRICEDGTNDECTEADIIQTVPCSLPDCPKTLGSWRNAAPCDTDTQEKSCGPGREYQKRNCSHGTTDRCIKSDMEQYARCNMPDCPKKLGNWISNGNCKSVGSDDTCGKGELKQTRTCDDGTTDKCIKNDTERSIECNLPSCFTLGEWKNESICEPMGGKKDCGPGTQKQTRTCTDGALLTCQPEDRLRSVSCSLPDCPKQTGSWINDEGCVASGADKNCGPGNQRQTRNCVDGTTDKCTDSDKTSTISCNLPDCPLKLGPWSNVGSCIALRSDKSCGPGRQTQTRTCEDGTNDKCQPHHTKGTKSCALGDCPKELGVWTAVGACIATGPDKSCGPGKQRQTRRCKDGTRDKCLSSDKSRRIPCNVRKCEVTRICSSWSYKYAECKVGKTIVGITLKTQHSHQKCQKWKTFGFSAKKIWVKKGCRATFVVKY